MIMNQTHNARIGATFFFFCITFLIIGINLFYIQVIRSNFFKDLGKQQYHVMVSIEPARAPIVDRTGKNMLAINKDSMAAFILPHQLENRVLLEQFLKDHFPAAYKRLISNNNSYFLYVKRRLTPEEVTVIKEQGIGDIQFLNEPSRFYPLASCASVIGITDIDNKGLLGLEFACNTRLSGSAQIVRLEKDARSGYFYFEKNMTHEGTQAQQIQVTLDSDLQFLVAQELQSWVKQQEAKEGAVIIMDPQNGDILSMVNVPTFDPNNTHDLDIEQTKNPIISSAYELGSVFKVFAALAALEEKVADVDELIDCQNVATTYIDGRKINTVKSSVRGIIPFFEVIAVSNNIGIAQIAKRVGTRLYDHYVRLGFGQKTGICLPGEHAGFVNHPNNWSKQSIISLSYGYEVSATLLQLAQAFCIFANNGRLIRPRILLDQKIEESEQLYSNETVEIMRAILENTTISGTAKRAAIKGYRVMSKTGTANMLINGNYDPAHNLYTCAGIVENDSYKRVIVTFIKETKKKNVYASTIAAPLFEKVAEKMLIHNKVV